MKRISSLFLLFMLAFGCEENDGTLNLKEGEFLLMLYNDQGDLLFTKKGDAESFDMQGDHWEIRFLDTSFGTQNAGVETFAGLIIFGQTEVIAPQTLQFNTDNSAGFFERWYSASDDWGYKSTGGRLNITYVEKFKIKGTFEINLEVDAHANVNPRWGEHLVAKGSFSSICPYEDYCQ